MRRKYISLATATAVWIVVVGVGMARMWMYSYQPGAPGKSPVAWPAASHLHHSQALPTIVMVLHPHCPCSRASIGELARLMTQLTGRLQADVVFVQPPEAGSSWAQTDLWRSVSLIRGATRLLDDGTEARLFGAATSGQTIVYDRDGRLRFSGGITQSRGSFGDSLGASAVLAIVAASRSPHEPTAPVYGCPLFSAKSTRKPHPETCRR
jgi:hypothetical protein